MKQTRVMFVATVLAVFSFAAASAQTAGNQPSNGSATNKEQPAVKKPQPLPATYGTQTAVTSKAVTTDKNLQTLDMNQLLILKKQAQEKGLPTKKYDIAIQQRLANQAK